MSFVQVGGSKFYFPKFNSNQSCKMSRSWNSLVSVATPLRSGQLRNHNLIPNKDKGFFLFIRTSRPAAEFIQPPIQWVLFALSLEIRKLRHEADHLPLSTIEVKNEWSCTFILPIRLQSLYRDDITFPYLLLCLELVNLRILFECELKNIVA